MLETLFTAKLVLFLRRETFQCSFKFGNDFGGAQILYLTFRNIELRTEFLVFRLYYYIEKRMFVDSSVALYWEIPFLCDHYFLVGI